jgi:hypothetical protein
MTMSIGTVLLEPPESGLSEVERSSTRLPFLNEADPAIQSFRFVARYDSMRLDTYRRGEHLGSRILTSRIGSALALRFDDVGYFNRVYCADHNVFNKLPGIEDFYRGSPFGCELVGPPSDESASVRISRTGWTPANRYAWLCHPDCGSLVCGQTTQFTIRPPRPSERQQFLLAYLRAFDAQPDRIPSALRNMLHLFDRPELHFLMAWHGDTLAGVAMMMRYDDTALLCAGAALPEFREMGCHVALLAARIRLASSFGCRQLFSWAALGGQSQANMEKVGLEVVGSTTSWRYSPVARI